ncbi:MAG: hypothetical protein QOK40_3358 [Miltoncostaeaceae bacterium]|nr:hypothetical protein [Miltoncostaeaceae bacterium]
MAELPDLIDPSRHRDLGRRGGGPWGRRAALVVLAALVGLGAANVFGQQPSDERAGAAAASLELHAPSRLRDGLLFQARFTIVARRAIAEPTLVLDGGWFDRITVNTVVPEAKSQVALDGRVGLTFDRLPGGRRLVVWISFQVNPPGAGRRDQGVELRDGEALIARIPRTVLIFP